MNEVKLTCFITIYEVMNVKEPNVEPQVESHFHSHLKPNVGTFVPTYSEP